MSNTRGGYSSLSNFAGSNDGLIASAPGNDTAETFNLQPLNPRRFSGSTPSLPSRSDSRPRRSSPLSGQQLIQDDTPRTYSMPDDRPRTYVAEGAVPKNQSIKSANNWSRYTEKRSFVQSRPIHSGTQS